MNKLYKIWFSNDQNVFLPYLNQVRLRKCRQDNPQAIITLIYSHRCLSEPALLALKSFCIRNKIVSVDFDSEILNELFLEKYIYNTHSKRNRDFELCKIVESEIIHTLTDTGGNLASASDVLRLVVKVIQNYGLYTDFDVEVKLKEFNYMLAPSFIMLYGRFTGLDDQTEIYFSNEVMTFSVTADGLLHPEALSVLNQFQARVLRNYDRDYAVDLCIQDKHVGFSNKNIFSTRKLLRSIHQLKQYFSFFYSENDFNRYIKDASDEMLNEIYMKDFNLQYEFFSIQHKLEFDNVPRQYLENHMLDTIDELYKETVMNVSGPRMMAPIIRALGDVRDPFTFTKFFVQYSALLGCFKGNCYRTDAPNDERIDVKTIKQMPGNNDSSWTCLGREVLHNRSKDVAALAILNYWRKKRSIVKEREEIDEKIEKPIDAKSLKRKLS